MSTNNNINIYKFKPFTFELIKPNPLLRSIPLPRSGHRIVCSTKFLYVYGGYNPKLEPVECQALKELWRFNFASRKWKQCAKHINFPDEIFSVAALRKRQRLFIFGGTGLPFGTTSSNKLQTLALNGSEGFSTITIFGDGPDCLYGQAMVLHKNILYTIGGTNALEYSCDVHRVNLYKEIKVWKTLYVQNSRRQTNEDKYKPKGRFRHEVAYNGTNIYVLGGGTMLTSYPLDEIPVFNIPSQTWLKAQAKGDGKCEQRFPQPRKCHGTIQLKTETDIQVYVMGGYQNAFEVYNDLWRLELSTLQWTLVQNNVLPKPVYFHSTTVTKDGKMYSFGGIKEGREFERTNDLHAAWMCIPKLSEISWDALLYYIPAEKLSKEMFKGLKLPRRFIERVE